MNRTPAGYEIVNSAELASLRRKAQAHDAYLWATKRMADKAREVTAGRADLSIGYHRALHDFAQLVKDAPME